MGPSMGPRRPRSTVLTEAEEAIVVEFRRRTLLPLDDVLGCLRESIPTLSRSALHRCLVRHGLSRLPKDPESASKRKRFAETKIGYVHIDTGSGRWTRIEDSWVVEQRVGWCAMRRGGEPWRGLLII